MWGMQKKEVKQIQWQNGRSDQRLIRKKYKPISDHTYDLIFDPTIQSDIWSNLLAEIQEDKTDTFNFLRPTPHWSFNASPQPQPLHCIVLTCVGLVPGEQELPWFGQKLLVVLCRSHCPCSWSSLPPSLPPTLPPLPPPCSPSSSIAGWWVSHHPPSWEGLTWHCHHSHL